MFRKKTLAVSIILCAILIAIIAAPHLAAMYIRDKYPFVNFKTLSLSFDKVTLKDATISKDGMIINSPEIVVAHDYIVILGGSASISIEEPKELKASIPKTSRKIFGHLKVVTVKSSDQTVVLRDVNFDDIYGGINFNTLSADINYHNEQLKVLGFMGRVLRKQKTIEFARLTINHVSTSKVIKMLDVSLDWNRKGGEAANATIDTYGSLTNFEFNYKNGEVSLLAKTAVISHESLFSKPLYIDNVRTTYNIVNKTLDVTINGVTANVFINDKRITSKASCQAWLNAMPPQMKLGTPLEDNLEMNGDVEFDISAGPKPNFDFKFNCSLVSKCSTLTHITDVQKPFKYFVYDGSKNHVGRESGPGSKEWVPRGAISEHLVNAVIAMEDPGFPRHNGILIGALKNSFLDNVRLNKFLRGGSTITMQTVKNVWLSRDKNAGRKVQELFLAITLSKCLSKDQIIELYLNVIEYGKNLYGVSNGANYYFSKSPGELDPVESFFLASILPHPRTATKPNEATLLRIENLMFRLTSSKETMTFEPIVDTEINQNDE